MFDPDLLFQARWHDLYVFFAAGDPPLVMRLLLVNTAFLMFVIYRRAKGKPGRKSNTSYGLQAALLLINGFVMMNKDLLILSRWTEMLG